MQPAVYPEMAPLAHGADVRGYLADWVAAAQVCRGEADLAPGPLCSVSLALNAAPDLWVRLV